MQNFGIPYCLCIFCHWTAFVISATIEVVDYSKNLCWYTLFDYHFCRHAIGDSAGWIKYVIFFVKIQLNDFFDNTCKS